MTTIDPRTTLGELVTEHPDLSRFFDALGLDYCCGGGRTVEEACAAAGVDVEALERAVASTAADRDAGPAWTTMDPAELTVHIETTHHASLHRELPRLLALADKVVAVHGDRHPELAAARATLRELGDDLGSHLRQEEQVVFPMIRALSDGVTGPTPSVPGSIAALCAEHDRAGELLATLRAHTGGYVPPPDACASYRAFYDGLSELQADLHLHVHKENNCLFPAAIELERTARHHETRTDATERREVVQVRILGANCPSCFESMRAMLSDEPGVREVRGSFSGHCLEVALGTMSAVELTDMLHRNLHGIDVAGNGEQVMVGVEPSIGEWHCHP